MKNVLWLALGIIVGVLGTYFFLKQFASEGYLEKAIHQFERRQNPISDNDASKRVFTGPISYDDAKTLVTNYQTKSAAYLLNMIRTENMEPVKSWVIDLRVIDALYPRTDYQGLRVYPCEHNSNGVTFHSLVAVPARSLTGGSWENIVNASNSVFQYVLPCPDNCNQGNFSLGD